MDKSDKPATKSGDMKLASFRVCKAENGYKLCACYEKKNKTLAQKAGWVPSCSYDDKEYVYKTEEELVTAVKSLLKNF